MTIARAPAHPLSLAHFLAQIGKITLPDDMEGWNRAGASVKPYEGRLYSQSVPKKYLS